MNEADIMCLKFCEILDQWYLKKKTEMSGQHSLGFDKERTKEQCCALIYQLINKYEGGDIIDIGHKQKLLMSAQII